jgi:hypothetical protein
MNDGILQPKCLNFMLLLILLLALMGCQQAAPATTETPTEVPPTATAQPTPTPEPVPPQIDGSISAGEWDNARTEYFADGSELLLIQTGEMLYLAIRANTTEMIAGNVFVQSGDEVNILHTSAALGTAVYQQRGESWLQTKGFSWCCREASLTEAANAARTTFFADEGWMGINSRVGTPNELEYQIALLDADFRLAVNFLVVSNTDEKIPFPADLTDDCTTPTPGQYPTEIYFSPETWFSVIVAP